MGIGSLEEALCASLESMLGAERLFRDALPQLSALSSDGELSEVLQEHHHQTLAQLERLRRSLEVLGRPAGGTDSVAGSGLVAMLAERMALDGESPVREVAIIAAVRAVESFEICSYCDAVLWAKMIERKELVELLTASLEEERAMDQRLVRISQRLIEHSRRRAEAGPG